MANDTIRTMADDVECWARDALKATKQLDKLCDELDLRGEYDVGKLVPRMQEELDTIRNCLEMIVGNVE